MSTLCRLTLLEGRLFLREPVAVAFGVLFPTVVLLALGAVPALRQPSAEFGGARFVVYWAPTALVLGIGVVALQHAPTVLATYRESGVLRRLSTTPAPAVHLLVAHVLVALAATVVAAALLVGSAWLVLDVPLPRYPGRFALAFLLGFAAMLAIGTLVAAVAPNARAAAALTYIPYLVTMFAGGVFLPRFLLPDPLVRLGEYTPPGVQALLDAWSGQPSAAVAGAPLGPPQPLQLGIMALVALAAAAAAAKLFRWE